MRQVICLFVYIEKNPRFTAFLDSNLHTRLAIVTENELGLAFPPRNLPKKFRPDPFTFYLVIVVTSRQTDRQTNAGKNIIPRFRGDKNAGSPLVFAFSRVSIRFITRRPRSYIKGMIEDCSCLRLSCDTVLSHVGYNIAYARNHSRHIAFMNASNECSGISVSKRRESRVWKRCSSRDLEFVSLPGADDLQIMGLLQCSSLKES